MNFYASADTQITPSDYYLGQISISLSMNSWTIVTLHGTLPVTLPAGSYYVGWIIDPENINDETNEDNNTAFNGSALLIVTGASGSVIYVDVNARGAEDGSSWENAFHSLQDALAEAVEGCEIRVADGVYTPDRGARVKRGDRRATFELKTGVAVVGGYAGAGEPDPDARDVNTRRTILSGDLNGDDLPVADPYSLWLEPSRLDNSRHVVTAIDADGSAILEGVRVMGGCADGWFDPAGTPRDSQGAGMYISGGGPRVRRCVFSGNWASMEGGAVYVTDSNPELLFCTLCENAAVAGAQGHQGAGGAVSAVGSELILTGCTLNGNLAGGNGGALVVGAGGSLAATNCCFHANHAGLRAGAIHASDSRATLVNCTIAGNRQDGEPGVIVADSELHLANCILWNDGQQIESQAGALITVAYSDVRGGWLGIGNIDADPLPADPYGRDGIAGTEDDDLRLDRGSPCIDAGSTAALPRDAADLDTDANITEPVPFDCDGNLRVVGTEVDMGAYEAQPSDAAPEPTDP